MRSTVHRPQHADVVVTQIPGPDGQVAGLRLFLGLFAASAYNRNPRSIPLLAEKVARILAAAGYDPEAHDGTGAAQHPRYLAARRAVPGAGGGDPGRAHGGRWTCRSARARRWCCGTTPSAASSRPSPGCRGIPSTRGCASGSGRCWRAAFGGRLSAWYIALGDAPLARVHYIIGTDPDHPRSVDAAALEAAIAQAARRLPGPAGRGAGGGTAARPRRRQALARWRDAFPAAYREAATGAEGAADLALAERALAEGRPAAAAAAPARHDRRWSLRLANPGGPAAAGGCAAAVREPRPAGDRGDPAPALAPADDTPVVLHVFTLAPGAAAEEARFPALLEALAALLDGRAEADGFNRLVLRAGLDWRECWLLRAMFRWLKQVGFAFAQESVEAALAAHPAAARLLVDLFQARFDPDRPRGDGGRAGCGLATRAGWRWKRPGRGPHPVPPASGAGCALLAVPTTSRASPTSSLKIDSARRATCRCRGPGGRSSCIRRAWKACICAPAPWRAAASAGPTGGRISAPRSSG